MSATGNFYQSQADLCGQEAKVADLPLLREKFLRSQRAWQVLADRSVVMEAARKTRNVANIGEVSDR